MTEPFGKALKALREQAGINLYQMHKRTGLARSYLYVLEAGEVSAPTEETLNTIARVLDIDPEELYELAWKTAGTGPGLPPLPTYFRAKYQLDDEQIAAVERTIRRVTAKQPGTEPTTAISSPTRQRLAQERTASAKKRQPSKASATPKPATRINQHPVKGGQP